MLGKCPVFSEGMCGDCGYTHFSQNNELEKTFCKIADKVGVKINDRDIESCHRVDNDGRTIVKFSHRKDCQQLMKVIKRSF